MQSLFHSRDSAPHALPASFDALVPAPLATATFGVG
jgi:hypothetical protein